MRAFKPICLFLALLYCHGVTANIEINRLAMFMTKDKQERIWLATPTGLLRYEGEWINLTTDQDSPFHGLIWVNSIKFIDNQYQSVIVAGSEHNGIRVYGVLWKNRQI